MFWNFGRVDKINELLDKEGVTLEQILDEDSFSSSVRSSSNQKLFDFLSKDENMTELLKYALTDEYKDRPKYTKFANASVTVFSSSRPFQQIFLNNELFKAKLKEFTTSVPPSSRTCGHYQRIIESIANGTKGQILNELTNFTDFLINNITDMALKDLFVLMSTEFTESFGLNTDLLIKLVSQINDENGLFVVSCIREIMKANSKDLNEKVFDSDNFIDSLFKTTIEITKSNQLLATELLRLIKSFNTCKNYEQVLQKYQQNYEYQKNISLPFQVQVFNQLNPDIFECFFDPKSCSLLVEAIYNSFINKTQEEKIELSKSCNLRSKSIEFFEKSITNARVSDISKELYTIFKDSPDADQTFNEFFETKVNKHIELRESQYGGRVVDDDDEEYEDEDENDDEDDDEDDGIKKMSFNSHNNDDDSFDSDSNNEEEDIDAIDDEVEKIDLSDDDNDDDGKPQNIIIENNDNVGDHIDEKALDDSKIKEGESKSEELNNDEVNDQ